MNAVSSSREGGGCSFWKFVQGPKEAEDERKAGMQAVGNGKLLV